MRVSDGATRLRPARSAAIAIVLAHLAWLLPLRADDAPAAPGGPAAAAGASEEAAKPNAECDSALGKRVFAQCSICHSIEPDAAAAAGPNLHGVVGRAAASAPGFSYSKSLRDSNKRWSAAEIERFLEDPSGYVPGTTMAFAGLKKPEQRAAVVCYLQQQAR